ncbi:MAG: hypothetical protein C0617_01790 [Desulfuromonas sp.]|uniref:hypothetical protein n=1 Tax=Desulfuromonas sp. TaxID=892 RepID=UPI000CB705B6|nr:hypothetical protein [Desulfuromonas sp.]PLX86332.1 MAG: hypothetical protein C0617_01790 [Desulfuromonas sp.]
MNVRDYVIFSIVGSTCLVVVLVLTALFERYILQTSLNKRIDYFRKVLNEELQTAIRAYKSSLNQQDHLYRTMVETRSERIVHLFNTTFGILKKGNSAPTGETPEEARQRFNAISREIFLFLEYFARHSIHLETATTDLIQARAETLKDLAEALGEVRPPEKNVEKEKKTDKVKPPTLAALDLAWRRAEPSLREIRDQIKEEYDGIYKTPDGAATNWS